MNKRRYWVADFGVIAFAECALEGNALYYLLPQRGDWRQVFSEAKADALQLGAGRIIHGASGNWRASIRRVLAEARRGSGPGRVSP